MRKFTWLVVLMVFALGFAMSAQSGWTIPEDAKTLKSPLPTTPTKSVLSKGKSLFTANCEKCHGPQGKGDGPDSKDAADLTDEFRYELNPDGVLFYKIMNGHPPEMPAFKSKFAKDETWAVVEYVKSLRKPQQ